MAFEATLFSKTRFKEYRHCLELSANPDLPPLWERFASRSISLGPARQIVRR